jgi:exodeoxyribonuclease VII small subunit
MPAPVTKPARPPAEGQSFELSLSRLGEIVEQLEAGELPLEESLRLFEEGVSLARAAQTRLDSAEKRVEELLGLDENGDPLVRELGDGER